MALTQNPVHVVPAKRGLTGQTNVAAGPTATQIVTANTEKGVAIGIKAKSGNAASIYYGFSNGVTTSNGMELQPGEGKALDFDHAETEIWIIGTAGEGVCWEVLFQ